MFSNIDVLPLGMLLQVKQKRGKGKPKSRLLNKLLAKMPIKQKSNKEK